MKDFSETDYWWFLTVLEDLRGRLPFTFINSLFFSRGQCEWSWGCLSWKHSNSSCVLFWHNTCCWSCMMMWWGTLKSVQSICCWSHHAAAWKGVGRYCMCSCIQVHENSSMHEFSCAWGWPLGVETDEQRQPLVHCEAVHNVHAPCAR